MPCPQLRVPYVCLCLCVCAAVYSDKSPVSFNDALSRRFAPEGFNGVWISSNEYFEDREDIMKYNVETKETTVLLNQTVLDYLNMTDVTVSADGKWAAVQHDEESIFRHSTTSLYTLIELSSGQQWALADGGRVQLLVWAPEGSGLAFVADNDVYYQSEQERRQNSHRRITNTATATDIYNGIADWVYEEEVLEDSRALWFSPDGDRMVFATLNDTNVRNVTYWKYGDPSSLASQYVQPVVIKYPKVGTRNPVVYLNYVNLKLEELKPQKIKPPEDLVTRDNILGPVSWVNSTHVSVTWMERLQTQAYTLLCAVDNKTDCQPIYHFEEPNGWLDIVEPVWVNSSSFLTVLPQPQQTAKGEELGNYRQLSLVHTDGTVEPLTSGLTVVTSIDCFDRVNNIVYYTSTAEDDSAKKLVYKLQLHSPQSQECFSCRVDDQCSYGSALFSRGCSFSVLTCSGPDLPQYNLYNKDGGLLRRLGNNSALRQLLQQVELPTKLDLSVPVADGFTARVRLLLPPGMDQSGRKKYPALFFVYSGPDSNKIKDSWSTPGWDEYLSTKRGVVIVYVDGRGSGLRGDRLKFAIYHRLGGPEVDDILTVGRYLQEKYPFVDPVRTAIWGWSYGGFATAMALAKDDDNVFRCGISVAPVTNWIYYDTVYTERYMGLPTNESNWAGYQASDVSARVENLRHKLFYLIHGNADDNVHYQQSMMLSRALELADIMFFQQSYPDETHALLHVRRHLYHSMDSFWTRCFHLNESSYSNEDSSVYSE